MKTSESIINISKALIEFQSKMVKVTKDAVNPHFKNTYASLSQIIDAIQKPLNECKLTIIQLPAKEHDLETILLHITGEFISETFQMTPQRNDPQGLGSAITYQRRYALGAILCLNIDEDDDAEKASTKTTKKSDTSEKSWLSKTQLEKIKQRYSEGELDIIDKTYLQFKMRKEYRAELEDLKAKPDLPFETTEATTTPPDQDYIDLPANTPDKDLF